LRIIFLSNFEEERFEEETRKWFSFKERIKELSKKVNKSRVATNVSSAVPRESVNYEFSFQYSRDRLRDVEKEKGRR